MALQTKFTRVIALSLAVAIWCGCAPVCAPGASVACVGAGGCAGGQSCNASGSGFNACACEAPTDGGVADGAMSVADGGRCQAAVSYGTAIAIDQRAAASGALASGAPTFIRFNGALNGDAAFDQISLGLAKNYGAFSGGEIVPGTFEIAGGELGLATCGVCVSIAADVTAGGPVSIYLATGGTVTITSVSPNLTGMLTNVTFEHVDIAGAESTPAPDGCLSALDTLPFNTFVNVEL